MYGGSEPEYPEANASSRCGMKTKNKKVRSQTDKKDGLEAELCQVAARDAMLPDAQGDEVAIMAELRRLELQLASVRTGKEGSSVPEMPAPLGKAKRIHPAPFGAAIGQSCSLSSTEGHQLEPRRTR